MRPVLAVRKVRDFKITGDGKSAAWKKARWQALQRVGDGKLQYATRAKVLYSGTGIYFLFNCVDTKLTCSAGKDFSDLYKEDVVEVFLWPDESQDLYLEYELSPLAAQLPVLVPNHKGRFFGWLPWHFSNDRLTLAKTAVTGGPKRKMARVSGWTAEFFIPFKLLTGLGNVPPSPGTRWRANLYRMDYDQLPRSLWAWAAETGGAFHDFHNFGTFKFE